MVMYFLICLAMFFNGDTGTRGSVILELYGKCKCYGYSYCYEMFRGTINKSILWLWKIKEPEEAMGSRDLSYLF